MRNLNTHRTRNDEELVIDGVLTTQPELGPSIPDGGYGWIIFAATLFFQALIPSLLVSFGIYLEFNKLKNDEYQDIETPRLWDDSFLYVPLFFLASWTFFEPTSRKLITNCTWPRFVATAGTCLTCAGLLIMWMGMSGTFEKPLYVVAGILTGVGASIQMSQCEIILAQYFRLKHIILSHVSQAVVALGFILVPGRLGYSLMQKQDFLMVTLWYQVILLQGLGINLLFKKPQYLKSSQKTYNYITSHPEDDEDIFFKNGRELQIKRQNSSGENATEKVVINNEETSNNNLDTAKQNWVKFVDQEEPPKNISEWETFADEKIKQENSAAKNKIESSFAAEPITVERENNETPVPLFSDMPVNNNTTYAFEDANNVECSDYNVFSPNKLKKRRDLISMFNLDLLWTPTFYKSLLMIITTKFSLFIFYSLFPSYLFQKQNINFKNSTDFVGLLSLSSLLFAGVSYWININKQIRPIFLWVFCWIGSFGYFMLSDSLNALGFIIGGVQIVLSISSLQYIGGPLLGLTIRGEQSREFCMLSRLSGLAFLVFLMFNSSIKDCFRLMAVLHFMTGSIWFSNFVYKKIKEIR